jgi:hypothetical protein
MSKEITMAIRKCWAVVAGLVGGLLIAYLASTAPWSYAWQAAGEQKQSPRFTEEREAAVLFFVKKHVPQLVPLLEQLKKNNAAQYEREIGQIFQVTEWLADLREQPRRHDLELKIWIDENKANALVAQLSTPSALDRKRIETELQGLAKELVELEIQVLELKADQLEKELGAVKDELAKTREHIDKKANERYEDLVAQGNKGRN